MNADHRGSFSVRMKLAIVVPKSESDSGSEPKRFMPIVNLCDEITVSAERAQDFGSY